MKVVETDTAIRYQKIHQHQPVLILTPVQGTTLRGVILSPGKIRSLIRFNEDGNCRETRLENTKLVPVQTGIFSKN